MLRKNDERIISDFNEHVEELAATIYEGDERKAFRHASFQLLAPDPNLSDDTVIEMTAIDQSGDLEVDGWLTDEESETVFLFQSVGGKNTANLAKVTKFWHAPDMLLDRQVVETSNNQLVRELSKELDTKLAQEYSITMVFASRGGFAPSARTFANSNIDGERHLTTLAGKHLQRRCTFELFDQLDVAEALYDFKAGFTTSKTNVDLSLNETWTYEVERSGLRSIRATVPTNELVDVFNENGYKIFKLNPRGPIATAKVNKRIKETLESQEGRSQFHLLNNGMCATCDDFQLDRQSGNLRIMNFQIVNGCQTTYTLSKRPKEDLEDTFVDLKLVVADPTIAQKIAQASNSQTALKARDYTFFEAQQNTLQSEFASLIPPWYYEVKAGYWRFVLSPRKKAHYKTGRRKHHIEVKDMAQASLAFLGEPSVALDRVRLVFEGIRSEDDRIWYEKAFPVDVKAKQLILAWRCLKYPTKGQEPTRYATFHILWLIAKMLRKHYGIASNEYFGPELSLKLSDTIDEWFPDRYRIANESCRLALREARYIVRRDMELDARDFFRGSGDYAGPNAATLIWEACDDRERDFSHENETFLAQLPA